jgi:DNA-binding PadR family transcriptional regulator
MSVRHSLLAILDQGPCYGYQLRAEYARRTGAQVNVGQVYTTLERLERDGLVGNRGADAHGHVYWGITEAGRERAHRWLLEPNARPERDELAHKIALSATLPGVDAGRVIAVQREAAAERLALAQETAEEVDDISTVIVRAAQRSQALAEVEWLDAAARAVSGDAATRILPLSTDRPRRGRPSGRVVGGAQ